MADALPADQAARDRIRSDRDRNLFVEAGAIQRLEEAHQGLQEAEGGAHLTARIAFERHHFTSSAARGETTGRACGVRMRGWRGVRAGHGEE